MLKTDHSKRFKLSVLAMALAIMPLGAQAAGLGRLTVTSALGQPLRAEIELTASREEVSSMSARLAPVDAFTNAGIDFSPALSSIRFKVDRRPNGQVFLTANSDRPFSEPFIDMLVEVSWASGRLVREYTFLLDPPDVFKKPATAAPVFVPEVKKEAPAVPSGPAPAAAPQAAESRAAPPAAAPGGSRPPPKAAAKPAAGGTTRQVVRGDTLAKIADETKPAGVSLDQMLAALLLDNKDVFDGANMNRLRAGKILRIPDNQSAMAVEPSEARRIVVTQAADFNAYRRKLAALAAAEAPKEAAPAQVAAGKIAPKIEETPPSPAPGKDKLEVSRAETGKGATAGARIGAVEEDLIAHDKALKEANARIAELEKNLADLRKLAEMKSAAGTKSQETPVVPAEAAKPASPALAVPAQPVEAPKPAAPLPSPAAKKPAVPLPPRPSFIEESPGIVLGGGGVLALLLGYLGYGVWRRKRQAAAGSVIDSASSSSVSGPVDGQSVDTGSALPTDFSQQPEFGAAGDEGVDPVAEADVYIAYGRDTQAEEILLEALKTDPTRCAIHLKLLEIYAARKDAQSFEAVARELYGLTGGNGADWEKAATLGRSVDPANPLYGGGAELAASAPDMVATVITTTAELQSPAAAAEEPLPPPDEAAPAEEVPAALDFDLDLGTAPETEQSAAEAEAAPAAEPPVAEEVMSLDFDLGAVPEAEAPAVPAAEAAAPGGLDFDLDTPAVESVAPAAEAPAGGGDAPALDFDFDLSEPEAAPAPLAEPEMPALDLAGISLDLDEAPPSALAESRAPEIAEPEIAEPKTPEPEVPLVVADDPEVATKLELAQAYEEMGDKEGARELLNEVLNEGSPSQQEAARNKLAELG